MTLKKVNLKNKSRKGKYYYAKEPKKPGRYYKHKEHIPKEIYELQYKKGKGIKEYQKAWKSPALKKIRQKPHIEPNLKKGIGHGTIQNIYTTTNNHITTATKKAFKTIVKDKDILNIITQEGNLQKLKHRLHYTIKIKSAKDELITCKKYGTTPTEIIRELTQNIKKGEYNDTNKEYEGITEKLKQLNYQALQNKNNGNVQSISLTITTRKG